MNSDEPFTSANWDGEETDTGASKTFSKKEKSFYVTTNRKNPLIFKKLKNNENEKKRTNEENEENKLAHPCNFPHRYFLSISKRFS